MDLNDDPNGYEDITIPAATDLVFGFQLTPWDATGSTASFIVNGSPFAMTVTVTPGEDPVSEFDVRLTPSQLATLGLAATGAVASYVVRYTAATGAVLGIGYGQILIT